MLRQAMTYLGCCGPTLTAIREVQLNACEQRLSACPRTALFAEDVTEASAQMLFDSSYYAEIMPGKRLHTLDELRAKVMNYLPSELSLLPMAEYEVLTDLYNHAGLLPVKECDDLEAAESLVRRLWIGLKDTSGGLALFFPEQMRDILANAFDIHNLGPVRDEVISLEQSIHAMIYINGAIREDLIHASLFERLSIDEKPYGEEVLRRFMFSAFDCYLRKDGLMILIHPALIDPESQLVNALSPMLRDSAEDGLLAARGILSQEIPLHESICGALTGAVRPEYELVECAEDLRLLIKQGVSFPALEKVMASFLATSPTEYMNQALMEMYRGIPRWPQRKGVLN